MRNGNGVITVRTARSRYPALNSLLDDINGCREVVVTEGGVLPQSVARSTARRSGNVYISYRLVKDGVLVLVPEGQKVRKVVRTSKPSHVVEVRRTDEARRRVGTQYRSIRAATVVIYEAPAS